MNANQIDWYRMLEDALSALRTIYKTPISESPYHFVYGKVCHFPVEHEHKELWASKRLNLESSDVVNSRLEQINEMDEFCLRAYDSSALHKEKIKLYHDQMMEKRVGLAL